ncbi:MAGUK p55 subfamily member 4-like protein [Lates japonicus]|uniref:MAGUK p55 subfamily member 4-like protein n=1 Tax=Lates japonicus TaxID=270547 RepID=A0AAD3NNU0_LATJO|nr:MAGUK p55 subfamily member 4-like protein [Lates japonicus]
MMTMRHAMEDGVSEVLSSVVDDIGQAVSRNVSGAQLLHELLCAPWLRALLKMYECLLQFQRLTPSPFLPYASGLSHEIMTVIQKVRHPSAEARELYSLLSSPHIQALLSSHDSVAQSDYGPVLPPLPDELPGDEEAMRIVCLVKNNQPLTAPSSPAAPRSLVRQGVLPPPLAGKLDLINVENYSSTLLANLAHVAHGGSGPRSGGGQQRRARHPRTFAILMEDGLHDEMITGGGGGRSTCWLKWLTSSGAHCGGKHLDSSPHTG